MRRWLRRAARYLHGALAESAPEALLPKRRPTRAGGSGGGSVILDGGVLLAMSGNRIEINSEVMLGKPVIRGTRVTVDIAAAKTERGCVIGPPPRCISAADTVANDETIFVQRSAIAVRFLADESCGCAVVRQPMWRCWQRDDHRRRIEQPGTSAATTCKDDGAGRLCVVTMGPRRGCSVIVASRDPLQGVGGYFGADTTARAGGYMARARFQVRRTAIDRKPERG